MGTFYAPYQQIWNAPEVQVIRPETDVSAHVYRDDKHVVMRLNRDNYRLTKREAVLLANELVDAIEKETP